MNDRDEPKMIVAAVVLAAGLSRRMGQPKMALPWGETTVIGQVVQVLAHAGVQEIVAVTGGAREMVEAALGKAAGRGAQVRSVFNPDHANGEMLLSLQVGVRELAKDPRIEAALVTLGDQPQIQAAVITRVLQAFQESPEQLIVPSYHMHRGHPWLLPRADWPDVLALHAPETLRDYLNAAASRIHYLEVDTPSVLMDLDTPEDYQMQKPA